MKEYQDEVLYHLYAPELLKRLISAIKVLCEPCLAFLGKDEHIGSAHNGNYLGIVELLAEYDPFLAQHIQKYGNQGKRHASYLSSSICKEVIDLMGKEVLSTIVKEVKSFIYYSTSVDSTPASPVERFLAFLPMYDDSTHNDYKA